jgi:tRNA_anti-like
MSTRTRPFVLLAVLTAGACVAGCMDQLPDQDRRILTSTPAAKLSADLLWKEYAADPRAADRRYWGRAVEISGTVTRIDAGDAAHASIAFEQDAHRGIEAHLLADQAASILSSAVVGQRLTLRCFCAGLVNGSLELKSCVRRKP